MSYFEKPNPLNKSFLAAWHASDRLYAKIADIKVLAATDNDIQFKFPDIRPNPAIPKGTMYAIPLRRINETDEEWGSRCVIMENIGDPK